ncbi:NAD(P)-binding protein [Aspergillus sclerotioniger CBS 115572]|uniref:NAD(P)-binding protein n=1 Tax=Aspergillus sclerotioniger CBS 115572 TaxID=1450535 RepID=A0A317V9R0_9EURO|nr:NAD(P)-binding protein [Aspergillus sclerotioniger CBS 115572]PWY70795.1 NAD(P)-binding protein [Aspergillus sclerotioniger CBS 115572]
MSTKPLILITGANQGLGFATATHLANTGRYHLLIAARSLEKAETAIQELQTNSSTVDSTALTPLVIDVTDDDSIRAAAQTVTDRFGSLDILINNAGISRPADPTLGLRDSFRAVFELNVFGVAVMTATFLPLLRASTYPDRRIVNVSSGLGQIGIALSPTSPYNVHAFALPIYRSSKTAVNMLTAVDAVTLAEEGILAVAVDPGYCRTNFNGNRGLKDPGVGSLAIVRAATEGNAKEMVGGFVDDDNSLEEFGW